MSEQRTEGGLTPRRAASREVAASTSSVAAMFAHQVRRRPGATAVESGGEWLTYGELDRLAEAWGQRLGQLGAGPGSVVAVLADRSVDLVAAFLAVLRRGAAYLPLDAAYPSQRLRFMLDDSRASVVMVQPRYRDLLPAGTAGGAERWLLERAEPEPSAPPCGGPIHPLSPAYVVYTSGSTGEPKGALCSHRGLTNRALGWHRDFGLGDEDVVLLKTPLSFDVSLWEMAMALTTGARLAVAPPGAHRDAEKLVELVRNHGVTVLQLVPTMVHFFLAAAGGLPPSLRLLAVGGEALTPDRAAALWQAARCQGRCRVFNCYGPSEAAIDVTAHELQADDGRRVCLGAAVDGVALYVLDRRGALLPPSVEGELAIGGAAVGQGYLGRPGRSAERFVPDPFGAEPGERLYLTGDRVRRRADGKLEFLGRADEQVKLRGHRIEPGEVEAALVRLAAVREAAAAVRRDETGERLIAYVVPASHPEPAVEGLRAELAATLPPALVPASFVFLDRLPTLPSGKLDRRALPSPPRPAATAALPPAAPRPAVDDVYPLSPLQEGMLFHSLYDPRGGEHVEQLHCRLLGRLDTAAFSAAWAEVVERHPALRAAFVWEKRDEPFQVVYRGVELPWRCEDWRQRDRRRAEADFEALLAADRRRGFELSRPPLQRFFLVRAGDEEHRFLWTHHHLLLDGWSMSRVLGEVFEAYRGHVSGSAPPPPRPYRDFIRWLKSRDGAADEAYWRRELAGWPGPTPLPAARPSAPGGRAESSPAGHRSVGLDLTAGQSARLAQVAASHRLTVNVLVQAAWALLLSRHDGGRDVVFGTVLDGRPSDLAGVESMVGLFLNTVPVRVRIDPGEMVKALWRRLQAVGLDLRQHQHAPLPSLRRWAGAAAGVPLFETLLVFESYPLQELDLSAAGLAVADVEIREQVSFPLSLVVHPGSPLRLRLHFDAGRVEAVGARLVLQRLGRLLTAMAQAPDSALGDLSMGSAAERHRVEVEGLQLHGMGLRTAASPAPGTATPEEAAAAAPRNALEEQLTALWAEVLGMPEAAPDDDFFALGGDSILALRLVSKARRAGLRLSPRQLFDHPTAAALAAVVRRVGGGGSAAPVTGAFPLTPIQHWFFEQQTHDLHHWNQAVLLRLAEPVPAAVWPAAVHHLLLQHDALRSRFSWRDGAWRGWLAAPSRRSAYLRVDLSALPPGRRRGAMERAAATVQGGFALHRGPLLAAAGFDLGGDGERLLLVAHHLVVDLVSWSTLVDDLENACRALAAGSAVELGGKGTSVQRWGELLTELATGAEVTGQLEGWRSAAAPALCLPVQAAAGNTEGGLEVVALRLPIATVARLLDDGRRIEAALLTALARAVRGAAADDGDAEGGVASAAAAGAVRVDVETHGREEVVPGVEVTRTVGWFTSVFPLRCEPFDGSPGAEMEELRRRLTTLPQRGLGHGLLRHLHPDAEVRAAVTPATPTQIGFNYAGRGRGDGGLFRLADESPGPLRSPRAPRQHLIDVEARRTDDELQVELRYAGRCLRREVVEALAERMRGVLAALAAEAGSPDPAAARLQGLPADGTGAGTNDDREALRAFGEVKL